jgi:hypothetical protein
VASSRAVASAIAASLTPEMSRLPLPPFLTPEQRRPVARALASLERYHGALLAEPVGSGKTYEALAVGACWGGRGDLLVLAPAAIVRQWTRVAARLEVSVMLRSHERVSRGSLPRVRPRLVIIDESHRFRNPRTRRYRTLAPWLVGIPVLLLSATPLVNRPEDIAHQLLLGVRDDALAWQGIPSCIELLGKAAGHPALAELVICEGRSSALPRVSRHRLDSGRGDMPDQVPAALDELRLSTIPGIASLLRSIFYRAYASSPAALIGVLRRYQHLLAHAREARAQGRPFERTALREFTQGMEEQLVLWAVLPDGQGISELTLEDAAPVDRLLAILRRQGRLGDQKADRLAGMLVDGRTTLVFCSYQETVHYLRDRLAGLMPAWCTGARAGIGQTSMEREAVLGWFRPAAKNGPIGIRVPHVLLATEVLSEGLDLQQAERVVHYDLPWTAVRLAQREGRAARLGSSHRNVEVIGFEMEQALEERLRLNATLERKLSLPAKIGLGDDGRRVFRWRSEIAAAFGDDPGTSGIAAVESSQRGILAGFELIGSGALYTRRATSVGWLGPTGDWTEQPESVEPRIIEACESRLARAATAQEIEQAVIGLTPILNQRLRACQGSRWMVTAHAPHAAQLLPRLQGLVAKAVRKRDRQRIADLERAIEFVGGGHSAGESDLLATLVAATDASLIRLLGRLPAGTPGWASVTPRVTGIVVFTSGLDEGG